MIPIFKSYLLTTITTCFALLFFKTQANAQSAADSATLIKMAKGVTLYSVVNNQIDSFAALWNEQATFITIAGLIAKGKDKIVDMHKLGKYIIDSSSNTTTGTPLINFVNKKLAITYYTWGGLVFKIRGKTMSTQPGYLTCVFVKTKESWKIISATNATNGSFNSTLQFSEYSHSMWKALGIDE